MRVKQRLKRLLAKVRVSSVDFNAQKKATEAVSKKLAQTKAQLNQVELQLHRLEKRSETGFVALTEHADVLSDLRELMTGLSDGQTQSNERLSAFENLPKELADVRELMTGLSDGQHHSNERLSAFENLPKELADVRELMTGLSGGQHQSNERLSALENLPKELAVVRKRVTELTGKQYRKQDYFEITSELGVFTVPQFRQYLQDDSLEIAEKIATLKSGTDEGSHQAVDIFIDRVLYYLPEKLPNDKAVLFNMEALFTEEEIYPYKSGKTAKKTREFRKKYDIGTLKTFLCPIFYGSGLYYLDDPVLETIKGSIVLDCGAYWGDTAIIFSEYSPQQVYAFEPVPRWYDEMENVLAKNNLQDVITPVRQGVSDQPGFLYYNEADTTSTLTDHDNGNGCDVTSLDQFMSDKEGRVGLIKYDVEGMDFQALKGSEDIIRRDKPILLTSIYHEPDHFFHIKPYLDSLGLGYKHKIRKLAKSPLCDLMLISWVE